MVFLMQKMLSSGQDINRINSVFSIQIIAFHPQTGILFLNQPSTASNGNIYISRAGSLLIFIDTELKPLLFSTKIISSPSPEMRYRNWKSVSLGRVNLKSAQTGLIQEQKSIVQIKNLCFHS